MNFFPVVVRHWKALTLPGNDRTLTMLQDSRGGRVAQMCYGRCARDPI